MPAEGLGVLSLFASSAQTRRSRRFGERYPTCQRLFMRGVRFRPTKRSSPTHARKKPLVPRVGEWQKAATGTSLKMFLKRSVDCRMGCFLRSMSWMLGRAGTAGIQSLVSLVAGLFSFKASFQDTCFALTGDLFFNEEEVIIYSLTSRTTLRGAPPFHLAQFSKTQPTCL